MRRRATSSTLLLLMIIFFISLLALTCAPYNHNTLLTIPDVHFQGATTFSSWLIFNDGNHVGASTLLNQTTRMTIFDFVQDNPGVHFRALSNYLGMPIGLLQYHLGLLVNGGLLSTFEDGRYKRYFESKRYTETEMKIIAVLRHETSCKILTTLLRKPQIAHKDLAAELNISSQALSWQMKQLEKTDFIKRNIEGLTVKYSLDDTKYKIVSQCVTLLN